MIQLYLKRIEIYGFKSFADRVELEFDQGITAVVGPNGSGKSNISDAIKWVLGEQKVKSLRGSKMEDVIFAGTVARKPLGYAEVTLILDNKKGVLGLEYDEISVTRRLYRSGESEYLINKTPCRLKDVQELFADTGLGKEGYSIIGQGKIDSIVSSNPQNIRHLFDEAAGIVKFKNRKLESERKLERTVDNIHRITDIVAELEKQLGPLKRQRKKAQIYLEHAEELKRIQLNVFVNRTEQLDAILNNLQQELREALEQQEEKKRQIEETDVAYQQIRREIGILDGRIDEINEAVLELSQRTERSNTDIQVTKANMRNAQERIQLYKEEKEELLSRRALLEETLEQQELEVLKCKEEWDEMQRLSHESFQEKEGFEQEIRQIQQLNRSREMELEKAQERLQELLQEVASAKSNVGFARERSGALEAEYQSLQLSQAEKQKTVAQKLQEKKELEDLGQKQQEKLEDLQRISKELDGKKNDIVTRRNLLGNNLSSEQSRLHMLEEDQDAKGYYRSVKNLLSFKRGNPHMSKGIRDIAGNLLKVDQKFAIAIETAMGGAFQHMVVDDDAAAKECIRLLNEKKWGRATFLPLTTVKGKREKLSAELNADSCVLGLAIDLIDFDGTYEGVFAQILGKTLIVEDMEGALKWSRKKAYRGKIVTLKGEVFHPGGAIVGGTFNRNNLLLQRSNHIQSLKQSIRKIKNELEQLDKAFGPLEVRSREMEEEVHELRNEIHHNLTGIRLVDQEIRSLASDMESLQKSVDDNRQNLEENKNAILALEEDIAKMESERQGFVQRIEEDRSPKKLQATTDLEQNLILCAEQWNSRRIEAARLETLHRSLEDKKKSTLDALEEIEEQAERKDGQILILEQQIKESEMWIENKTNAMSDAEEEIKILQQELSKKQQERKEKHERFDYLENQLKGFNHERMLLNETVGKLEVKINSSTLEKEHLAENIFEDYQMTYLMAKDFRYDVENMELEMKNAKALKDKIKGLGNINLAAIDQYEEVKERYTFLTEQREDLLLAKDELKTLIKEISKDIEVQFIEQFAMIQTEFNKTFKGLFEGGNAGLVIVDDEDIMDTGIEIVAQPPGKKLKNITLLSGGEKSLTAIALLFAIIGIKPAPFCVLDEIDAALDDSNVDRFAHFLSLINKDNQFITITHRKGTMEIADRMYGVTMGRDGVSKMLSVQLSEIV